MQPRRYCGSIFRGSSGIRTSLPRLVSSLRTLEEKRVVDDEDEDDEDDERPLPDDECKGDGAIVMSLKSCWMTDTGASTARTK